LGYDAITTSKASKIASVASGHADRVILASLSLPDLKPKALRRKLNESRGYSYLIYTLDRYAPDDVTSAFEAGADDIIAKPLVSAELKARLRQATRVLTLEAVCARVASEATLFDEISARTSFHSRRYLDAQLPSELMRASRFAHPIGLALARIEADPWDERDMRAVSGFLSAHSRQNVDWVARYDEHEIAFVYPETMLPGAVCATQRLDTVLSSAARTSMDLPKNLSINFGVTALDPTQMSKPPDPRILLDAAESYLHDAIRSGREIVAGAVPHLTNAARRTDAVRR
jgi:PleD family two-component response regulator